LHIYRGSIRVQSLDADEEAWCNLGPISGNRLNLSSTLANCKEDDILFINVSFWESKNWSTCGKVM